MSCLNLEMEFPEEYIGSIVTVYVKSAAFGTPSTVLGAKDTICSQSYLLE